MKIACLRLGADDYLVKPIAPEELQARIAAQVRRSKASRVAHQRMTDAHTAAHTDALTGLFNRRFLDEDLTRRVQRAQAGHNGFAVAMVDLDHFKRINDTWGHPAGDAVLRATALCLRQGLRESDLACRYGGEELVLVLPSTPLADASTAAERLRRSVEELECAPLARGAVTVSVGLAEWHPGEGGADLLARADAALYQAKRNGRNRVELSGGAP